jgi:thioredoxin reductase
MRQIIQEEVETGDNILVVDYQNHLHGLDTAEFLADLGKKVELITESVYAGGMVDFHTIWVTYTRVISKNVKITTLSAVKEIVGRNVIIYNVLNNTEKTIGEFDTVVFCTDGRANDSLYRSLKGKVKELYMVGQCVSPRRLLDSIHDGARVARAI